MCVVCVGSVQILDSSVSATMRTPALVTGTAQKDKVRGGLVFLFFFFEKCLIFPFFFFFFFYRK